MTLAAVALALAAGQSAAPLVITGAFPRMLAAVNGTVVVDVTAPPPAPAAFPVNVTLCNGATTVTTAQPHRSGMAGMWSVLVALTWWPSCTAGASLGAVTLTIPTVTGVWQGVIPHYAQPAFDNASVVNLTTSGFQQVSTTGPGGGGRGCVM